LLFLVFKTQSGRALALLQTCRDPLQNAEFELILLLLLCGTRLFQLILETIDASRDNFEVGEKNFLAETAEFVGEIAAGKAVKHDQKTSGIAHDAETAWIVAPLAREQARRIEKFDLGRRCLLRLEMIGQPIEAFVAHQSLADLTMLALGGIGRH